MAELKDFTRSVALLVSSCDSFFDAWGPFHTFLQKFWSDCPLEIFLITNHLQVRSPRLCSIAVGADRGWSSNLLAAIGQLTHPWLLYFQEDYFLTAPVDDEQVADDFAQIIAAGADSLCFRARTQTADQLQPLNERFGIVPLDSDGRTRCQVTLWKRSSLQSILRPNETAWDFEARGSARTQAMQIFSYLRRENTPIPYLMSAISRGLWTPEAIALCRKHEAEIDSPFRPTYTTNSWQRRLRRMIGRARLRRALRGQRNRVIEL